MNEMGKYWKPGSVQPIAANIKESPKATLSKGVLGMKFMKRKLEANDQDKTDDIKRKKLLDKTWEEDKINSIIVDDNNNNIQFTYDKEDLFSVLPGRRSFKAFNITVDRVYEQTMNANNFNSLVKPKINEQEVVDMYLKDNLISGKMKKKDKNNNNNNNNHSNKNIHDNKSHNNYNNNNNNNKRIKNKLSNNEKIM